MKCFSTERRKFLHEKCTRSRNIEIKLSVFKSTAKMDFCKTESKYGILHGLLL